MGSRGANQKETIEAASIEQLALVEECKALRSALVSLKEEREVLKEQNFQAETELKEFDVELNKAYLTSKCKLQVALNASSGRLEYFQSLCEKMEEAIQELNDHKSAARKENDELLVELQNLRSRC